MRLDKKDITAVILAGGQGRRMGGLDKGLIEFDGKTLVETLIGKLKQQSLNILINANRNKEQYEAFGQKVIADQMKDFQGPLAGIASAMMAVKTPFILTMPCDSPLLTDDYADRFINQQQLSQTSICVADDGNRLQPVHALIQVDLLDSLTEFLQSGDRKIDRWYAKHAFERVDFSDAADMFHNINTPEDQQALLKD